MLSNLKSGKRLFPLFDFTTGFGAFPARLRTNDQMTVGCLLRSLRLPKKTNLRFFDRRILPPIMFLFDTYCRSSKTGSKETTCPSSTTSRMNSASPLTAEPQEFLDLSDRPVCPGPCCCHGLRDHHWSDECCGRLLVYYRCSAHPSLRHRQHLRYDPSSA